MKENLKLIGAGTGAALVVLWAVIASSPRTKPEPEPEPTVGLAQPLEFKTPPPDKARTPPLPETVHPAEPAGIFKENNHAVVAVLTYDENGQPLGRGSGFIVRADGAIVTNYHVIDGATDVEIKTVNGVLEVEGLILADKENDIAILKAKGARLPTVKIGDSKNLINIQA